MNYVICLFIAVGAMMSALHHLGQGPERLWDFVAFAMVIGCTVAVAAVLLPWSQGKLLLRYFGALFLTWRPSPKHFIQKSLMTLKAHNAGQPVEEKSKGSVEDRLLSDGLELIHLGFSHEKIQAILEERKHSYTESGFQVAGSVRSLAKYPPAFGLAGTVFGLVELMRGVSAGMPAQETGVKMAIALVATLYGLLVSNLIVNPAGEFVQKIVEAEEKMAEIAIQSVLLIADNSNLLEAQEVLNSFVMEKDRVNILDEPMLGSNTSEALGVAS